jgi:hypothetical protein
VSAEELRRFHAAVLADRNLQDELLATRGREAFVALVLEGARAEGCDVEAADVEKGLRDSREAWSRRWI